MILVVGGLGSGRWAFVESLGFALADVSSDLASAAPVLLEAQELVRDIDVDIVQLACAVAASKRVVVCQEVGSGIVPIDRDERLWRERAGEFSRELAARADSVVRLACGIPQVIKGEVSVAKSEAGNSPETPRRATSAAGDGVAAGASFFTNRACEHFPCHEGVDEAEFNCLFCYCPLYALGPDCGGNFTYLENGRKNCKDCSLPHVRDNGLRLVVAHYEQLAALARA